MTQKNTFEKSGFNLDFGRLGEVMMLIFGLDIKEL